VEKTRKRLYRTSIRVVRTSASRMAPRPSARNQTLRWTSVVLCIPRIIIFIVRTHPTDKHHLAIDHRMYGAPQCHQPQQTKPYLSGSAFSLSTHCPSSLSRRYMRVATLAPAFGPDQVTDARAPRAFILLLTRIMMMKMMMIQSDFDFDREPHHGVLLSR
jgi:hypothetical protein